MQNVSIIIVGITCAVFFLILVFVAVYYFYSVRSIRIGIEEQYRHISDNSIGSICEIVAPSFVFSKRVSKDPCCICFDHVSYGTVARLLPCSHLFHSHCIEDWIQERQLDCVCPLCKKSIFVSK